VEYKEALEIQLQEKEMKKQQEIEQFLKDKQAIDDIVQKIIKEDQE
jgi:hypothetical protein